MTEHAVRHDWSIEEVQALFALPFQDLLFRAQSAHRAHQAANTVQMSTLLSVKTGACPEDCAYCPQSIRYDTGLDRIPEGRQRAGAPRAYIVMELIGGRSLRELLEHGLSTQQAARIAAEAADALDDAHRGS